MPNYRDVTDNASNPDKTTLADADRFMMIDSEVSPNALKEVAYSVIKAALQPSVGMNNGAISVTVASNNLTVAIKTLAGTDPTASDPVIVRIGNTIRTLTAALSLTVAAGANSFNAGSAELATVETDYFVYLGWKAASSAVVLLASRIPFATVYSDFSGTATSEKYAAYSAAPAATDDVVNVGRFAATLSAGAGYTWTVPSFTTTNLIQRPIYETRTLTWVPTLTGFGAGAEPTNTAYRYQIVGNRVMLMFSQGTNGTSNATGFTATAPFTNVNVANLIAITTTPILTDNGTNLTTPGRAFINPNSATITINKDTSGAVWTNANGKKASFQMFYWI